MTFRPVKSAQSILCRTLSKSVSEAPARNLAWFKERKARMLPGEISTRIATTAARQIWLKTSHGRVANPDTTTPMADGFGPGALAPAPLAFESQAWEHALASFSTSDAASRLTTAAERLLDGHAEVLGFALHDLIRPDWDRRPIPEYPPTLTNASVGGSDKVFWEISRGNILTQLAAASLVSGRPEYAQRAATLLSDWCDHFAAPAGPMWESGVELGIRMQSWTWLRRLSAFHTKSVFETVAVRSSIANHLEILLRFPSSHSSANNHRLVEAAGLLTGGCCFADVIEPRLASRARLKGIAVLTDELTLQVSEAGFHREQAVDYHCFVLEVAFFALLEAELFGIDVPEHAWMTVHRMTDALHALSDASASPPRFGDADNSHVVQLDAAFHAPARRSLTLMSAVCGGPAAARQLPHDARSVIVKTVIDTYLSPERTRLRRPPMPLTDRIALAQEGNVVANRNMATADNASIWLSLRSGPLGYLPIAAHAHADLNAIELRFDSIPFLVDPGTFLYGEDPVLRRVFRETANHNTLALEGECQARYSGPFLWGSDVLGTVALTSIHRAGSYLAHTSGAVEVGDFSASHDGYQRRTGGPLHKRDVAFTGNMLVLTDTLEQTAVAQESYARDSHALATRALAIVRRVGNSGTTDRKTRANARAASGAHAQSVSFNALIEGSWSVNLNGTQLDAHRGEWSVHVTLDAALTWELIEAAADGVGWQAISYGKLVPATAVRGNGVVTCGTPLITRFRWERHQ